MADRTIPINRAPVLTLWAAVVAERLGLDEDEALTLTGEPTQVAGGLGQDIRDKAQNQKTRTLTGDYANRRYIVLACKSTPQ